MTNAVIRASMQIASGNLNVRSFPDTYRTEVVGSKGPVPGAITVTATAVAVDLSELEDPRLCRIGNLSTTETIDVGLLDGSSFYPLHEVGPGEFYVAKLSRNLGEVFAPGTGVDAAELACRSHGDACAVTIEAYEA